MRWQSQVVVVLRFENRNAWATRPICRYPLVVLIACCLGVAHAAAQQTTPSPKQSEQQHTSPPPHAVSIRFVLGYGYGGCHCYGGAEMEIGPGKATLLKTPIRECQH